MLPIFLSSIPLYIFASRYSQFFSTSFSIVATIKENISYGMALSIEISFTDPLYKAFTSSGLVSILIKDRKSLG